MVEFSESKLNAVIAHYVGNQSRDEGVKASHNILPLTEELEEALYRYFTKPFEKITDDYRFFHEADLKLNEVYSFATDFFASPDQMIPISQHILNHLYKQSQHPHIKPGELYVAYFSDAILEGEISDVLGIFKSEQKDLFLEVYDEAGNLQLQPNLGINVKKLDKGCLIFNTEKEEGYRVLSIDANNYDADYWLDDFLNIKPNTNEAYHTKQTLSLVKNFTKDVVSRTEDKKDQAVLMNRALKYFEEEESFKSEEFEEKVLIKPAYKDEFKDYQKIFSEKNGLEPISEEFDIAKPTVKKERRKLASLIKLDTNVQIKMDFKDPESADKFIERGYDEHKQMHFYTIYFNHEKN
jgi:hypothetical protein